MPAKKEKEMMKQAEKHMRLPAKVVAKKKAKY